jgi:hypothetical protein
MDAADQDRHKVAVIENKLDNLTEHVKALDRDLRGEVRYLRRVLLGLLVSIALAAIVFGLTQVGP